MLRNIGKQSGESVVEKKRRLRWEDLKKRKVLIKPRIKEWGVMDDERMEVMEEVALIRLGESELERLVRGWWREA